MFKTIGQNSKGWKGKMRIPMFKKIGHNSSVWKYKIRIPMIGRITATLQCLEV